jgi:hypothetical protein
MEYIRLRLDSQSHTEAASAEAVGVLIDVRCE